MDTLYRMPGHLIRRLQQISTALFTEEAIGIDLTSVQFAALFAVKHNPNVDATRLSALIAFDRFTIGDVLERLEAKGLIVRSSSPDDRRIKLLKLTPAGNALLRQAEPAVRRVQERLLAPLSPEQRSQLVGLLTALAAAHSESMIA